MKRKINVVINVLMILVAVPMAFFNFIMIKTVQMDNSLPYASMGLLIIAGTHLFSIISGILGLFKKKSAWYLYLIQIIVGFGTVAVLLPLSFIYLPILLLLSIFALMTFDKDNLKNI